MDYLKDIKEDATDNQLIEIIKSNPVKAPVQLKYAYVSLDTNNKDTTLSTDTKYVWRYSPYDINSSTEIGSVSYQSRIQNIVAMRLFPIALNVVGPLSYPGHPAYNMVNATVNMNNLFTVLIEEFSSQAFIGRDGRKFHFPLFPVDLSTLVYLGGFAQVPPIIQYIELVTSGKGNGWFYFDKPISSFSTLSVSLGNPFMLVPASNITRMMIQIQFVFV